MVRSRVDVSIDSDAWLGFLAIFKDMIFQIDSFHQYTAELTVQSVRAFFVV